MTHVTRRRFLKSAGVLGAGATLLRSQPALGHPGDDSSQSYEPEIGDDRLGFILAVEDSVLVVSLGSSEGNVTVGARHFGPEWSHRVGDMVAVGTDDDGEVVAGPLVDLTVAGTFEVAGEQLKIGEGTYKFGSQGVRMWAENAIARFTGGSPIGIGLIAGNVSGTRRVFGLLTAND